MRKRKEGDSHAPVELQHERLAWAKENNLLSFYDSGTPEYTANRDCIRYYGITLGYKEAMWNEQDSKCAICNRNLPELRQAQVDYDHKTQEARGLLCNHCNLILANANDDLTILRNAIKYLAKYSIPPIDIAESIEG